MMVTLVDIEIVGNQRQIPANDLGGMGVGALYPKGAMPVRIRRRIDP